MIKTLYVDTALLDAAIERSGLKTSFIYEKLGISKQAFHQKRLGKIAFRMSEVYVLCILLHLSDDESEKIFKLNVRLNANNEVNDAASISNETRQTE